MTIYSIKPENIFLTSFSIVKQNFSKAFQLVKKEAENLKEDQQQNNLFREKKRIFDNQKNQINIKYQQAFISKKLDPNFQNEFNHLKEKIINYVEKDLENNSLVPINTKVYVIVEKNQNEILSSYPSLLYYRINKLNTIAKQNILEWKEDIEYYLCYFKFLRRKKFQRLPRRPRFYYIDLYTSYENLTSKKHLQKRFTKQKIEQNPIVLGFLDEDDARLYKKEILRNNFLYINQNKKIKRKIKKRDKVILSYSLKIKPTTLLNIKDSLKIFEKMEKTNIINTFILIPKFFNYSFINNKQKISSNFPIEMLSKFGFYGTPVYKTKQIEKKLLKSNSENFQDLSIPLRYLKTRTFFITLNKNEYEKLAEKDKNKLFFYEKEKDFTDNLKNTLNQQNKYYLKQTEKILLKIKNASKTLEKLSLIKSFISNNYYEKNLLEKTSYYIDKINKNLKKLN